LDNGGGTLAAGDPGIRLNSGSIPAHGGCTITVNVTGATAGAHANTIAALNLSTSGGTNAAAASATLTVSPPSLTATKSAQTFSDPVNGTSNPKAIPGAFVHYTITVSNAGSAVDNNSLLLADAIPANADLFVGDLGVAGSGPVAFTNGSPSSGLTYTFTSLSAVGDDVSFSNNGGTTFVYTPSPNATGVDSTVTHIRINPKGAFNGSSSFQVNFRARVE